MDLLYYAIKVHKPSDSTKKVSMDSYKRNYICWRKYIEYNRKKNKPHNIIYIPTPQKQSWTSMKRNACPDCETNQPEEMFLYSSHIWGRQDVQLVWLLKADLLLYLSLQARSQKRLTLWIIDGRGARRADGNLIGRCVTDWQRRNSRDCSSSIVATEWSNEA